MDHKIRLGPIAIFLTVVAVVLSTLAALTAATSGADRAMAERCAKVTQIRYELEDEGQKFVKTVDEEAAKGSVTAEAVGAEETLAGSLKHVIKKDGYSLTIILTEPEASGEYEIKEWKITKEWNAEDPFQNIWQGGGNGA